MLPVSAAAADAIHRLAVAAGVPPVLRVRVVAGGCSGLTWDVSLDAAPRAGDQRKVSDGVTVLVDGASAPYLRGARIELGPAGTAGLRKPMVDPDTAETVVVKSLRGTHACQCGESFSAT